MKMLGHLISLSAVSGLSMAIPVAEPQIISTGCQPSYHTYVTDQYQLYTKPFVGGISVPSGGSISYGEGYSVWWTVTVGASLGMTFVEVTSVGISASVSETTTTTTSQTATEACPGGGQWQCAALITPSYQQVDGWTDLSSSYCGYSNGNHTSLILW